MSSIDDNCGLFLHVAYIGDIKVVRFMNTHTLLTKSGGSGALMLGGNWGSSNIHAKTPEQRSPLELILELGVVGISVVDHRPRELAYLYMEKFFISYSTGYDGGTTSRLSISLHLVLLTTTLSPERGYSLKDFTMIIFALPDSIISFSSALLVFG